MLFCTDVSSMGVHTENLCVGVSLGNEKCSRAAVSIICIPGIPTDRWHLVQQSGRLGRDPNSQAIYITVYETNKSVRGEYSGVKYLGEYSIQNGGQEGKTGIETFYERSIFKYPEKIPC